jgi:hypothetical protein
MFKQTDIDESPWWVVEADDKRRARLNCIAHFLSRIDYQDLTPDQIPLPDPQVPDPAYKRPPRSTLRFVPEIV